MKILSQISGGYDSTTVMIKLLNEGHQVKGIFFNYGQSYFNSEMESIEYINQLLINEYNNYEGIEIINTHLQTESSTENSDYIPIRNLVLGTLSANYAIANGYEAIAVGNKTLEVRPNDPWSFADCSVEFYEKMTKLINFAAESNNQGLEFIMPLVKSRTEAYSKKEVIEIILNSVLDITKLWSCYDDGDIPCGVCYHCLENKEAFKEAEIKDPNTYKE